MKRNVYLILLFSFIALINSEIPINQITKALSDSIKFPFIYFNTDYYVTDLRITEKTIKHYKINLDQSFYRQVGINRLNYLLAEKIKDTGSPGFEVSLGGEKILIEGGFIDKNILHYYDVSYKIYGNFVQRKKVDFDENICRTYAADFRIRIDYNLVNTFNGDCPKTNGCSTFTRRLPFRPSCCCPKEKVSYHEQNPEEMIISLNIMSTFGIKIAKKDLLKKIQNDFSSEKKEEEI